MWFYFLIGIFLIVIGLAVHLLKWYFLIAGYNTMSKDKKRNVDIKSISRLMGVYCYVNGGIFILTGVLNAVDLKISPFATIFIFAVSTIYLIIKAQKYDGNIYDENGKLRKKSLKQVTLSLSIFVLTFILVSILMFFSSRSTKVTFLEDGIKISGMYGDTYTYESIEDVILTTKLPAIQSRTNGSALGSNLKGYFKVKDMGTVKLFVNTQNPPFILLKTIDDVIFFNMNTSDNTNEVYIKILNKISNETLFE